MTTTVRIEAHCSDKKEVLVTIYSQGEVAEEFVMQDGQSDYRHIYDDMVIAIGEYDKL